MSGTSKNGELSGPLAHKMNSSMSGTLKKSELSTPLAQQFTQEQEENTNHSTKFTRKTPSCHATNTNSNL
jgi:hypothetical protein